MPLKTHFDEPPSLNLTSMMDVAFLLIIFFMLGTRFSAQERKIELKVPKVSESGALSPAPDKRVINVYRDGQITLDREAVTLEELTAKLAGARQQYAGLGVIVRGDAEGAFQNVANVLAACRKAGVSDLGISVRMASRSK